MPRKISIYILAQLLVFAIYSLPNFGMNKPHLLFHLGDRSPISLNLGWGYWTADDNLRFQYQNTNDNLYVDMTAHNGENMFKEQIKDTSGNINTQIKYLLNQNESWQAQINMENMLNTNQKIGTTWFLYASIENNDYRYIDHEKYSTFISLLPEYTQFKEKNAKGEQIKSDGIQITVKSALSSVEQKLKIKAEGPKIFGLTANISQTFSMRSMVAEFKHLVQIERGQNVTRGTDKKLIDWENSQISLMKTDDFQGKNYVVVFIYGTFQEQASIFFTNSTQASNFNKKEFQRRMNIEDSLFNGQHKYFTKHVISNLLGGLTYYSGRLYTQNSLTLHSQDFCYSFTPSRLIFPRSFLWDDGFHQSVALDYHPKVVMDVLRIWLNKIDIFGWIGRQQIRGGEVSAMMPDATFVFQDWFEMNPPTLMLSLIKAIELAKDDKQISQDLKKLLTGRFHKLELWYRYFKGSQSHETLDYDELRTKSQIFYRWQCKDQCNKGNFMGSGLDDYPRRMEQTQISKQHVDVVGWLYLFSDSLAQISNFMRENNLDMIHSKRRINYYTKQSQEYTKKLYKEFLDPKDFLFKDIVVESKEVFIDSFVDHIGYINLFPFFTGMLRSSKLIEEDKRISALRSTLKIMGNQDELFSEDGLRSLSIADQLYGTDQNYWRGAIWMPINYMVLRACKKYYWNEPELKGEIRQFYQKLRSNLIETVTRNHQQTGYLYENYYQKKGHRGFPFYGWTSLIASIITEKY